MENKKSQKIIPPKLDLKKENLSQEGRQSINTSSTVNTPKSVLDFKTPKSKESPQTKSPSKLSPSKLSPSKLSPSKTKRVFIYPDSTSRSKRGNSSSSLDTLAGRSVISVNSR